MWLLQPRCFRASTKGVKGAPQGRSTRLRHCLRLPWPPPVLHAHRQPAYARVGFGASRRRCWWYHRPPELHPVTLSTTQRQYSSQCAHTVPYSAPSARRLGDGGREQHTVLYECAGARSDARQPHGRHRRRCCQWWTAVSRRGVRRVSARRRVCGATACPSRRGGCAAWAQAITPRVHAWHTAIGHRGKRQCLHETLRATAAWCEPCCATAQGPWQRLIRSTVAQHCFSASPSRCACCCGAWRMGCDAAHSTRISVEGWCRR